MEDYKKARRMAQRAYRSALLKGSYPYLQALEEILPDVNASCQTNLGLVEIPLERIAGTKTSGRTYVFADNFLPLLSEDTEFAVKWTELFRSHLEEGIREPITACEFMNRFYVVEGNKRVSVMKYLGAVSIPGYVTRILPPKTDTKENRLYYEFLDFYRLTAINYLWFSEEGSFRRLLALLGKDPERVWSENEKLDFHSSYTYFSDIFEEMGGKKLVLTPGDAFLLYLEAYGCDGFFRKSHSHVRSELRTLWSDFSIYPEKPPLELVMQPESRTEKPLLGRLISPSPSVLRITFLHDGSPEESAWTYGHELGRQHLHEIFPEQVRTEAFTDVRTEELGLKLIGEAAASGSQVIFTTSPRLLGASLRAAVQYPDLKILNCSLNAYSGHMRTYYGRMYEAKFLIGALAGILTDTPYIGYLADNPVYGMTANINAFALGVKMTNPSGRVCVAWPEEAECAPSEIFREKAVSLVSGQELIAPRSAYRKFGLYDLRESKIQNVATPIWHWGTFYENIVREILNGAWKRKTPEMKSINYWWGVSSGIIDVIYSQRVPFQTRRLIELLKKEIAVSHYNPFSGNLFDQNGVLRNPDGHSLYPTEIIRMNWLLDNVDGNLPETGR